MSKTAKKDLANHEIVTLAVYLLGGDSKPIDTEDVAIRANELAPGRYVWRKYPDQVNLELIRVYLSDAKKADKGILLMGSGTDGWQLTSKGLSFAKKNVKAIETADLARERLSPQEKKWRRAERERILASEALAVYASGGIGSVRVEDIESLFRVNSYVRGDARERKLLRIINTFGDDADLGRAIRDFEKKLKEATNG